MNYQRQNDFERKTRRRPVAAAARLARAIKLFLLLLMTKGEARARHATSFVLLTEGTTFLNTLAAFRAIAGGQSLLRRRPEFREVYGNLAALEACPNGSVGQAYANFMRRNGLDAEFYVKAVEQCVDSANDPESTWFHRRILADHDLRHLVSGYKTDALGEVYLLWFRFAQIRHWGIFALGILGVVGLPFIRQRLSPAALREAYRRGSHARTLDLVPWEDELDRPLSAHRAELGLTVPIHYPASVEPEAYVETAKQISSARPVPVNAAGARV